jgi:hypothetical protein
MTRLRPNIIALSAGVVFLFLALAHAHVTIATNDMRAYRPVLIRAATFAVIADACFVVLLVRAGLGWRLVGAALILLSIDVFLEIARRVPATF